MDFSKLKKSIADLEGKKIFFISGSMSSGTTWLQLLCNSHPNIACCGEAHFFPLLYEKLSQCITDYNGIIYHKKLNLFKEIKSTEPFNSYDFELLFQYSLTILLAKYVSDKEEKLIGEKTPDHLGFLSELDKIFIEPKHLIINRDGRDAAVSAWYHFIRNSKDWLIENYGDFNNFVLLFAEDWNKQIKIAFEYEKNNSKRCLIVQYEALIQNKESIVSKIFDFLEVDSNLSIVRECILSSDFTKLKKGKINPSKRDSHFRKGISGDWENHFNDDLNRKFIDIAKESFDLCKILYSGT